MKTKEINIWLFKCAVEWLTTCDSSTVCPILGPINFVVWLQINKVGYTIDMMPRVITLFSILDKMINSPDPEDNNSINFSFDP